MPAYTMRTEKVPTKPQHHTLIYNQHYFSFKENFHRKKFICTLLFKHFCIKIDKYKINLIILNFKNPSNTSLYKKKML